MLSESERISLLQHIFDNVVGWLHFAEAKNAAVVAFNIAMLAAIFSFDVLQKCMPALCILVVLLVVSTGIALWSFKPINTALPKSIVKDIKPNFIHFAYLAGVECDAYLREIYQRHSEISSLDFDTLANATEKDYCDEIIQNARIIIRKQKLFKAGLVVDMVSLVVLVICIICA